MNHPACSADRVEAVTRGVGPSIIFCVLHLIAGVAVALVSLGALALFAA